MHTEWTNFRGCIYFTRHVLECLAVCQYTRQRWDPHAEWKVDWGCSWDGCLRKEGLGLGWGEGGGGYSSNKALTNCANPVGSSDLQSHPEWWWWFRLLSCWVKSSWVQVVPGRGYDLGRGNPLPPRRCWRGFSAGSTCSSWGNKSFSPERASGLLITAASMVQLCTTQTDLKILEADPLEFWWSLSLGTLPWGNETNPSWSHGHI